MYAFELKVMCCNFPLEFEIGWPNISPRRKRRTATPVSGARIPLKAVDMESSSNDCASPKRMSLRSSSSFPSTSTFKQLSQKSNASCKLPTTGFGEPGGIGHLNSWSTPTFGTLLGLGTSSWSRSFGGGAGGGILGILSDVAVAGGWETPIWVPPSPSQADPDCGTLSLVAVVMPTVFSHDIGIVSFASACNISSKCSATISPRAFAKLDCESGKTSLSPPVATPGCFWFPDSSPGSVVGPPTPVLSQPPCAVAVAVEDVECTASVDDPGPTVGGEKYATSVPLLSSSYVCISSSCWMEGHPFFSEMDWSTSRSVAKSAKEAARSKSPFCSSRS